MKKLMPPILAGIVIGGIGIFLMETPWTYAPGIVFDTRSILLSISGFFLGTIPTLIAVFITVLYRFYLGGDGIWMGIAVIIFSGTIGILWKKILPKFHAEKPALNFLLLGFAVHITMLISTVLLPANQSLETLKTIALPVLTIYPIGTMLLGILMNRQFKNWQNRKAKDSLVESERRFSDLLKNIKLISVIIDNNKSISFCNEYLLQITGYSREELIGQNWLELLIKSEDRKKINDIYNAIYKENGNIFHFENDIITKDSVKLTISWNNTVLRNEEGKIIGIASIGENITEKKLAIEALKKSEDKFNTLYNSSPDAITLTRLSDRIIVDINQSACKLTGFKRDELIGQPILSTQFWFNNSELKQYAELISTNKKVTNFEAQFKMKSGEVKTALVSGEVIQIQNDDYVIGVIRDITQRKDAEKKLLKKNEEFQTLNKELADSINQLERLNNELKIAKEKAEESNRLKTVFLQNISHEIRTPMNGILGFLSLMKNKNNDNDIEKWDNYIDIVNKSGQRLLNTVNDIIEISKIETKQITVNKSLVNLQEVIEHYFHFSKVNAEEKGLELKLSGTILSKNVAFETDKHLLDSILLNLINNAIKFTPSGTVELGSYKKDNFIVFFVKDTGIGIPKDRLEAIFDRFVQAEVELSRSYEGSGLGLAIVKAYAALLEGKIWVESEEGKGSTFFFAHPYTPSNKEVKELVSNNNPEGKIKFNCKILIAEDDEISYLYIKELLEKEKVTLIHAKNGDDAIKYIKANPEICLILMDIKMPGMNGLDATQKIRKFNKTTPIIAQTAYAMEKDITEAIKRGCNDYISKPIDKVELLELLKKYIIIKTN